MNYESEVGRLDEYIGYWRLVEYIVDCFFWPIVWEMFVYANNNVCILLI